MTRQALLLYVQNHLAQLATAAKLPSTADTPGGFGPVLDQALRALGTQEADLANAATEYTAVGDLMALARYYGLQFILTQLATAVDIAFDAPAMSKKRSQLFTQVSKLLNLALKDISALGYGPQDFVVGRLQLDIFEPNTTAYYGGHPGWWGS